MFTKNILISKTIFNTKKLKQNTKVFIKKRELYDEDNPSSWDDMGVGIITYVDNEVIQIKYDGKVKDSYVTLLTEEVNSPLYMIGILPNK